VPSANITLELDYSRAAETVTDPSETVDVPEDWQEALILGLASRMASMFGKARTDGGNVGRIDAKAAALYQHLLDRDRPDSYYFEPDV
jgi:streptomycin 6-kinase